MATKVRTRINVRWWAWPTAGYLQADGVLDCKGPLSGTIAPNVLAVVNKEVKLAAAGQKKMRGLYSSFTCTPKEKARVVQYSSVNGIQAAVQQFSRDSIENLSMVC